MHRDTGDQGHCRSIGTPSQRWGTAVVALFAFMLAPTAAAQAKRVFELASDVATDFFGRVEWVGDLDGDGFDDFVVGAPKADVDLDENGTIELDEQEVGVAHFYSGRHATAPSRTWRGDHGHEEFGSEIAPLGDLDGDGVVDFGIAAPGNEDSRKRTYVRVISGRSFRDPSSPEVLGDVEDRGDRDANGIRDGNKVGSERRSRPRGMSTGTGMTTSWSPAPATTTGPC